jgi:predicted esterase
VLEIFVSHGTLDAVIPVENTRENIVPTLRALGNDVTYREFEGAHGVPAEISEAALDWFLAIPEGDARLPGSGSRP